MAEGGAARDAGWRTALLVAGVVLADQLTKGAVQSTLAWGESVPVIDGLFSITHVRNPGAAWGLGASATGAARTVFLLALPVVACVWLVHLIWTTRGSPVLSVAYALVLSGAVGNLIDRFSLGYVVDFLDVYVGDAHFPAFNVADSAITVGAVALVASSLPLPRAVTSWRSRSSPPTSRLGRSPEGPRPRRSRPPRRTRRGGGGRAGRATRGTWARRGGSPDPPG